MDRGPYAVSWVDRQGKPHVTRFSNEESARMFGELASINLGVRGVSVAYLPQDETEAELIYESPVAQFLAEDR